MEGPDMLRIAVLLAAILVGLGPVHANQEQRLTGAELKELFSDGFVRAGWHDAAPDFRFIIAAEPNGTQSMWYGFPGSAREMRGEWQIKGDQYCRRWGAADDPGGFRYCGWIKKVGDRYEQWVEDGFGDPKRHSSFFILPKGAL
jgi:hypothetical protein